VTDADGDARAPRPEPGPRSRTSSIEQGVVALLASAIEFLPDATFVLDAEKRVVAWNRACEVMTGVPREAVLGKGDYAYAEPFYGVRQPILIDLLDLTATEVEARYKYVHRKGHVLYAETFIQRLYNGKGAYLWGEAACLFDRDGRRCGAFEVVRDITEHKRVELALRESELKYRTLFDAASDAIFLMWQDRIVDCNARTLKMYGCSRDQMLSASPAEFSPPVQPDGRPSGEAALEKIGLAMTEGAQLFEWEHRRADGSPFTAEVSLNRLELSGETLLQAIVRDITERKRAEEQVRELNADLQRHAEEMERRVTERTAQLAVKSQELKELAHTVSHDLKAPLGGIAVCAAELDHELRAGLSERARSCLSQIRADTSHLDALIEDLLRYSQLDTETPSPTTFDLGGLVARLLRDRELIVKELHAVVTVDISAVTVQTWEQGLVQVLSNLIDNALKYSRNADPPRLRIAAEERDGVWRVTINDNGIGFDMKHHDRIFKLFNRLVRMEEFDGTGAGLAIAKKVLEKQGGRLWAESAPGQGATFFVELPRPPAGA
jgi:PAS domain S-box-containing protein